MSGTLVLVRHGQSEWNLKNLFTGWKDPDLTDQGRAEALAGADMKDAALPVFCNVTAATEADAIALRQNLVTQVTGRVRWRETILAASKAGVSRFVEIGTGKVLSGLVKRTLDEAIIANVAIVNFDSADDLDTVLGEL